METLQDVHPNQDDRASCLSLAAPLPPSSLWTLSRPALANSPVLLASDSRRGSANLGRSSSTISRWVSSMKCRLVGRAHGPREILQRTVPERTVPGGIMGAVIVLIDLFSFQDVNGLTAGRAGLA